MLVEIGSASQDFSTAVSSHKNRKKRKCARNLSRHNHAHALRGKATGPLSLMVLTFVQMPWRTTTIISYVFAIAV